MYRRAFTLAEVLLTLAIIGVVAALTIPAVIIKVTQEQYVVGLKKAYNTLKTVEREAIQEDGQMENWSWANSFADFDKYFRPHLDILKDCGTDTDDGCFADKYMRLDGTAEYTPGTGKFNVASKYHRIITSDGVSFAYASFINTDLRAVIYVDVNGKKNPNVFGRDLFVFHIYPSALGIKPQGAFDTDSSVMQSSKVDINCKAAGHYCTTKVLAEGQMNY